MDSKEEYYESAGGGDLPMAAGSAADNLSRVRDALAFKSADAATAINSERLQPERAFEVFAGKTYFVQQRDYSLADPVERRVESPLQRFARLRGEVDDLSRDLDEMVSQEINADASVWSVLQKDARRMIQSLLELQDHDGFGVHQRKSAGVSQRFEELSSKILRDAKAPPPAPFVETSSSSSSSAAELLSLERRVSALETMLGYSSNLLDAEGSVSLLSPGGTFPLVDSIVRLERRAALLDPATLDQLKAKAAALRTELESTQRLKGNSESQAVEAAKKVDGLYEQVEKIKAVTSEAPALIVRLKTLESIHSAAATFVSRLDSMEASVGALSAELKSNAEVLGSLQIGLEENSKIFAQNLKKMGK